MELNTQSTYIYIEVHNMKQLIGALIWWGSVFGSIIFVGWLAAYMSGTY